MRSKKHSLIKSLTILNITMSPSLYPIRNTNFSSSDIWLKEVKSLNFWTSLLRWLLYFVQARIKCRSSSISCWLHWVQRRASTGVLVCLPVSILNLWALMRSLVNYLLRSMLAASKGSSPLDGPGRAGPGKFLASGGAPDAAEFHCKYRELNWTKRNGN